MPNLYIHELRRPYCSLHWTLFRLYLAEYTDNGQTNSAPKKWKKIKTFNVKLTVRKRAKTSARSFFPLKQKTVETINKFSSHNGIGHLLFAITAFHLSCLQQKPPICSETFYLGIFSYFFTDMTGQRSNSRKHRAIKQKQRVRAPTQLSALKKESSWNRAILVKMAGAMQNRTIVFEQSCKLYSCYLR